MDEAPPLGGRASDFRAAAVKVYSKSDAGLIEFRGSGTAFRERGRCYVLTSDHVVLHAEKKHAHRVEGAVTAAAHFLAANWERGLALLGVDGGACSTLTLADLAPGAVITEAVGVFGYPWDVTERMDCGDGRVSDAAEAGDIFVAVPKLVRVEGCHGEFGMSGGPTATSGGKFLGVLSHQKLLDVGVETSSLLIIPASDVFAWLTRYFAAPEYRYSLIQTPQIQLEKREQVVSQNVWFSIGRYLTLDPGTREVCASGWSQSYTPDGYPDPGGYFPRIRARADDGCVYVTGFRENKFLGRFAARATTLVGFFRLFARKDLQPIVLHSGGGKPAEHYRPLRLAVDDGGCRADYGPLCSALREILERIEPPPHATATVAAYLVTPGDISYVTEAPEFTDGWKKLSDEHGIRRQLAALKDALAGVTL